MSVVPRRPHWPKVPPATWCQVGVALLVVIASLGALATFTHAGRTATKTALFIANLIPDSPVRPLNLVTGTPERISLTFGTPSDGWGGDLYLPPGEGPHPGIIIALGVAPAALDDVRVRRLGDGLARMGAATLIPSSPNLAEKRITPREIDFLVEAFQFLAGHTEVDHHRVGYVGICVGSSLSVLAAADERIANEVDFVSWFGGYYRADTLIASVVTETIVEEGVMVAWKPDSLTREVVRRRLLDLITDPEERAEVDRAITAGALPNKASLSEHGRTVFNVINSANLSAAHRHIRELPPSAQDELRRLSPATVAPDLRSRLYVMDDRDDNLISYLETRALVADLGRDLARYSEFNLFSHVDLDQLANPAVSLPQLGRLYAHVHAVLSDLL